MESIFSRKATECPRRKCASCFLWTSKGGGDRNRAHETEAIKLVEFINRRGADILG